MAASNPALILNLTCMLRPNIFFLQKNTDSPRIINDLDDDLALPATHISPLIPTAIWTLLDWEKRTQFPTTTLVRTRNRLLLPSTTHRFPRRNMVFTSLGDCAVARHNATRTENQPVPHSPNVAKT